MDETANQVLTGTRQMDDFAYANNIVQPPYEPKDLIALIERNDTLRQNIEAMASNVANFGHAIQYQDDFDYGKADDTAKKLADDEWETLRKLYKHVNPLLDLGALVYKMAIDMYSFGWGMLEILRDGTGNVKGVEYCRACNFRLTSSPAPLAEVSVWEETENGYEQVQNFVRFKCFVQLVNGKQVYFKEFGDKRPMNHETGVYSEDVPAEKRATELAYFPIHASYTDYGVPYWINTAITASGNILSELLNYKYFQDGRILPMAIIVAGGTLTNSSLEALSSAKGIDNAFKTLLLEASPFEDKDEDEAKKLMENEEKPHVSIDIKPLTDTHNADSLFRNYQLDGKEKIRDSMRLPPIYSGASADYNRATADTARSMAEEQIFVPERRRIADIFNKIINNERAIRYVKLVFKGPDMSSLETKAQIISALNLAGAVTPNMLLPVVEEVLGKDLELWNEEWGNIPFELLKIMCQRGDTSMDLPEENPLEKSAGSTILDAMEALADTIKAELDDDFDE